jgi:Zn-dependent protease
MLSRAVRLFTVRGVDVRLDLSVVILAGLLGWLLFQRFSAAYGASVAGMMAVIGSLLFFLSILAHELAHALEALRRGIDVHAITLLLFGGVTEMRTESERPRDEFVVAVVGPYISLVCAAFFGLVSAVAVGLLPPVTAAPVVDTTQLLALINLLLAVFNLVPGAPLDGGRVLRAGLWWLSGDRQKAIRGAARAGMTFGGLLVVVGAVLFVRGVDPIGTIWWLVIGWFLFSAARYELRRGAVAHPTVGP